MINRSSVFVWVIRVSFTVSLIAPNSHVASSSLARLSSATLHLKRAKLELARANKSSVFTHFVVMLFT